MTFPPNPPKAPKIQIDDIEGMVEGVNQGNLFPEMSAQRADEPNDKDPVMDDIAKRLTLSDEEIDPLLSTDPEYGPHPSDLKKMIEGLKPGDFVYLHPKTDGMDNAYFGIVAEKTDKDITLGILVKEEGKTVIEAIGIAFSYEREELTGKHIWMMKSQYMNNKPYRNTFTFDEIRKGNMRLYVGPTDVVDGMMDNNNRNNARLVKFIIDNYKKPA